MQNPDYSISTPENVDLHLELAGLGNRILAGLVDQTICVFLIVIMGLATWGVFTVVSMGAMPSHVKSIVYGFLIMVLIFGSFIIHFGFHMFFEGTWQGQTPGKRVAHIRVIEQNGQPVTWPAVIIRNLVRVIDTGVVLVGVLSIIIDAKERRFGDLAAGTVVVRERSSDLLTSSNDDLNFENIKLVDADMLDIGRISPQEYEILVSFLKRRNTMAKKQRPIVAAKLMTHFQEKLSDSSQRNAEEYLEGLYQAYRTRALT
jgi:uncharacterized RDD family membrane protein YckC